MSSGDDEKSPYTPPAQPAVIGRVDAAANGPFTPNGFDGPDFNYNSGPV